MIRISNTYPWIYGTFYKAVVWETLLFGLKTWLISPRIGRTIGRFHYRVDLRLAGIQPMRDMSGRREYLPMDAEMVEVGLDEVET